MPAGQHVAIIYVENTRRGYMEFLCSAEYFVARLIGSHPARLHVESGA